MSQNPLVTVICICYNHEQYVVEALNSIRTQTYRPIEIIIADDASSDQSVSRIKTWLQTYPTAFIEHRHNVGNTKTFNEAFALSKGEYIVDFAADDILLPNFIEAQVKQFQNTKLQNVGVVFSNMEHVDETGSYLYHLYPINSDGTAIKKPPIGFIYKNLVHSYFLSATAMMMTSKVLKELGGYDEDLAYEDVDFWFRSSRNYAYDYVDKVLMQKREVPNSLSKNFKRRPGKTLALSTCKICYKAFRMNQNKAEHDALKNRVCYELRLALKNRQTDVALRFAILLLNIELKLIF
ncbi:MAG: glycosyltransferase [Gelidibacter sp.]